MVNGLDAAPRTPLWPAIMSAATEAPPIPQAVQPALVAAPEVTVIIVSYNTRDLTLRAVETLLENSPGLAMKVVVFDNPSHDGSAEAVATASPEVEVIANAENIGFARANNLVAESAETPWLCLLNPDTETHPNAISNLLTFAKAHPQAGIVGGRTVFPDGSLHPASCWRRIGIWSLLTQITGLSRMFPRSDLFNYEAIGGWRRDSVREVDIVVGCFLAIPTELWRKLGGFNERYFMYGEDADLSSRAMGYRPMIAADGAGRPLADVGLGADAPCGRGFHQLPRAARAIDPDLAATARMVDRILSPRPK